jgi:hypothetical protein
LKKYTWYLVGIAIILIIFIVLSNTNLFQDKAISSDGLQTNITYMDGSTELVRDITIEGNLIKKKNVSFPTLLEEENTIVFKQDVPSDVELVITDSHGKEIFAKKMGTSEEYSFSATTEKGTIVVKMESGDHHYFFSINERN